MQTLAEILSQAIADHRAGRLPEAEAGYHNVLQAAPDQALVLHLLADLELRSGRLVAALQHIARGVAADPDLPGARHNINQAVEAAHEEGRRLYRDGRRMEAAILYAWVQQADPTVTVVDGIIETLIHEILQQVLADHHAQRTAGAAQGCRRILILHPAHPDALHMLALAEFRDGRGGSALRLIVRALRVSPALPGAAHNLANIAGLTQTEALDALTAARPAAAAALYARLAGAPLAADEARHAQTVCDLFNQAQTASIDAPAGGAAALRRAEAAIARRVAATHLSRWRFPDAVATLRRAVALDPTPEAHAELGRAQLLAGQSLLAEAGRSYQTASSADLGRAEPRDALADVARALETAIEGRDTPVDVRTQYWSFAKGFTAWSAYAGAVTERPELHATPGNPFLEPAAAAPACPDGRRVFDCFTFFNELEVLEIRLRELYDVVDRFVLVESAWTHAGEPKPLVFEENKARFQPYLDKLVHVVAHEKIGSFGWQQEGHQRECIMRGLADCRDDDMIIVSDADEILDRRIVARLRDPRPVIGQFFRPELGFYLYYLNLKAREPWSAAAVAPFSLVARTGTNSLRYLARMGLGHVIPAAGWHFTWMGGQERILSKLRAYAHQENSDSFARDEADGMKAIADFFENLDNVPSFMPGAGQQLSLVEIDDSYPALVTADPERYAAMDWIRR